MRADAQLLQAAKDLACAYWERSITPQLAWHAQLLSSFQEARRHKPLVVDPARAVQDAAPGFVAVGSAVPRWIEMMM
jgi:hypothetical protein